MKYTPLLRIYGNGYFGKIYALNWGSDSEYIITASQDGKLIIWSSYTGNKQMAITLSSAWVMTCTFSSTYKYISSGGLDNTISIFKVSNEEGKFKTNNLFRELEKHDGYISCCKFLPNDKEILSSSGDGTSLLWDINKRTLINSFISHKADIMSIDINNENCNIFLTGSVDTTVKIFDIRINNNNNCIQTFIGHKQDVNTVKWFIDNNSFITGSDDGTVKMFDMRSYKELNTYFDSNNKIQYGSQDEYSGNSQKI